MKENEGKLKETGAPPHAGAELTKQKRILPRARIVFFSARRLGWRGGGEGKLENEVNLEENKRKRRIEGNWSSLPTVAKLKTKPKSGPQPESFCLFSSSTGGVLGEGRHPMHRQSYKKSPMTEL